LRRRQLRHEFGRRSARIWAISFHAPILNYFSLKAPDMTI
jgi:hypothetical protein